MHLDKNDINVIRPIMLRTSLSKKVAYFRPEGGYTPVSLVPRYFHTGRGRRAMIMLVRDPEVRKCEMAEGVRGHRLR